jgi:hypothetical protein
MSTYPRFEKGSFAKMRRFVAPSLLVGAAVMVINVKPHGAYGTRYQVKMIGGDVTGWVDDWDLAKPLEVIE